MDAIEALMTTRAMRRFTDEPVTDDEVLTCLRAAQQAPTGGNVQPQQYVVVRDDTVRAEVAAWYRAAFDRYEKVSAVGAAFRTPEDEASWHRTRAAARQLADHLDAAPVLVVVLLPLIPWTPSDDQGPMDIGPLHASVYPAIQNLCVAARALGIGTTITTAARIRTSEVLAAIGAPDGYEIAAIVPMGRPSGRFGVARRKPVEAVVHYDRWGNKRR